MHPRQLDREPVRDLAHVGEQGRRSRAPRARSDRAAERADHRLEVLPLVVRAGRSGCARCISSRAWPRRFPATPRSPTSSTCWPTSSSWRAATSSGRLPTGVPRSGCARPAARSRSVCRRRRRAVHRQDDRREDRADRRGRRDRGARQAQGASLPTSSNSHASPAWGRRPRRIWKELDVSTMEGLKQAAESEQLLYACWLGPKTEENVLRSARGAAQGNREEAAARHVPAAVRAVVPVLREHPATDQVSEAGSVRRLKEQVRDLDIIATASDPAALTEYFAQPLGRGGRGEGKHESDGRLERGPAVRPPCRASRVLRQPPSALLRLQGAQRRSPRGSRPQEALGSPSTASRTRRPARSSPTRPRRPCTRVGYPGFRPSLRENMGELEAAREGRIPKLVELSDIRGDMHTRRGPRTERTRSRRWRSSEAARPCYFVVTDHSHYLREGRLEAQSREIDSPGEATLQAPQGRRGQHQGQRRGRRRRRGTRPARLGRWPRSTQGSTMDLTERVLSAMENPQVDCIGHLTGRPTRRGPWTSTSSALSRRRSRPARSSRSTPSPTGSTFGTLTHGSRGGRGEDRDLERRA